MYLQARPSPPWESRPLHYKKQACQLLMLEQELTLSLQSSGLQSLSCTFSLQESHSLRYPFKPSLSSPLPPSSLALPLQMAERGEVRPRAGIPIISSPSSSLPLQFQVCREMPIAGGHPSWAQFMTSLTQSSLCCCTS